MTNRSANAFVAMAVLTITACVPRWATVTSVPTSPTPEESARRYVVWAGTESRRWHFVTVRGDSLTGIPWNRNLDCEECRQALPRSEIDSVKYKIGEERIRPIALHVAIFFGAVTALIALTQD